MDRESVDAERAYGRLLDRGSQGQAEVREGYAVWFDEALGAVSGLALDFGSGRGQGLEYLSSRGFTKVEAYEPNHLLAVGLRGSASAVHGSEDPLAFLRERGGRYALILCKDVLEHVPKETVIETIRLLLGALAPGGRLIVSVPHAVSFVGVYFRYADFTHHTAFTQTSLRYVLESAGAKAVTFHAPRFRVRLSPRTLTYRLLKRCWHGVLKGIYYLENPDPEGLPPHFHPRLVASVEVNPLGASPA